MPEECTAAQPRLMRRVRAFGCPPLIKPAMKRVPQHSDLQSKGNVQSCHTGDHSMTGTGRRHSPFGESVGDIKRIVKVVATSLALPQGKCRRFLTANQRLKSLL